MLRIAICDDDLNFLRKCCTSQKHRQRHRGVYKAFKGGEIKEYTELMLEAREIATKRMKEDAKQLGADAIVAIRYSSADILDTACEVLVYSTAVKFL